VAQPAPPNVTRFGVQGSGQLVGGAPDPAFFREVAQLAEAAGFDSLWAGDHISFENPLLDVTVALSAFAAWTERIQLGAGVVLLPLRAPAVVAKEFASLDYLSGGRVVLGVGVGGEGEKDFEAVGVPIGERGARTDEAMRALRALFGGSPASFSGSFWSFDGVSIEPLSAQPGGPPLWVGGRSEAALRRAGELGDGWLPIWVSPERLANGIAELPDRVTRAVMLPTRVGGTAEEARLYLSRRYGTDISAKAVERYCVYGPPEACAERVAAYVEAGAEHVVFNLALEPGSLLGQIERLAEVTATLRSAVGAG
jgi:probable F420-dependent oxidoreductase